MEGSFELESVFVGEKSFGFVSAYNTNQKIPNLDQTSQRLTKTTIEQINLINPICDRITAKKKHQTITMTFEKVTVSAQVNAPVSKAWNTYTSPEHITHWNFAADEWCCPSASNDLRVGGKYSTRMEAKDGSAGFDFEGTYTDLTPESSLTYVLGDGRIVTTTFEAMEEASTLVTTVFDAENENTLERQRFGWQSILDNYKKHAENSM